MMNTREEQIDLAKRLIATGISDEAREVLEKQYPEIVESEDEYGIEKYRGLPEGYYYINRKGQPYYLTQHQVWDGEVDINGERRAGYIEALAKLNIDAIRGDAMHKIVDAYENLPKIHGWVARDSNNSLFIYFGSNPPKRGDGVWFSRISENARIPYNILPDLTWADNPVEVELIIKAKNV